MYFIKLTFPKISFYPIVYFKENKWKLKQYPRIFYLKLIHHRYSTTVPTQKGLVCDLSPRFNQHSVTTTQQLNCRVFKTVIIIPKLLDIIAQLLEKTAQNVVTFLYGSLKKRAWEK